MKSHTCLKARLKKLLASKSCSLIENPTDLLYLTGLSLSAGKLVIGHTEARLFVDGRYFEKAKKDSPIKTEPLEEAKIAAFLTHQKIKNLQIDSSNTSYDRFVKLQLFAKKNNFRLVPTPDLLKDLRVIKDKAELNLMRLSARLLWKGFMHVQKTIKIGMTEQDVACDFEFFMRSQGAEGMAFDPIIAFGPNTSMPHHRVSNTPLKAGQPVMVDIGVIYQTYRSDMTRMILPKKPTPLLEKYYVIVREAQQAALDLCAPGIRIGALDLAARSVMRKYGVEDHFLHGLGHGIGLETHEFPRIKFNGEDKDTILKPGMVITIEPGLYLPGKFGIRYEDTIAITKSGYENFYPTKN